MKPLKVISFVLVILALYAFGFSWRDLQRGQLPSLATLAAAAGQRAAKLGGSPAQLVKDNYSRILADYDRPLKAT